MATRREFLKVSAIVPVAGLDLEIETELGPQQSFAHLHVQSEYSLPGGACKIRQLIERTKELGMNAVAITDQGHVRGTLDFYTAAKRYPKRNF